MLTFNYTRVSESKPVSNKEQVNFRRYNKQVRDARTRAAKDYLFVMSGPKLVK